MGHCTVEDGLASIKCKLTHVLDQYFRVHVLVMLLAVLYVSLERIPTFLALCLVLPEVFIDLFFAIFMVHETKLCLTHGEE